MSDSSAQTGLDALAAVPPSFSGSDIIRVNDLVWGVVPGSRTFAKDDCVFVLSPSGSVHVLVTRKGRVVEIIGTAPVMARVTKLAKEELFGG